MKDWLAKLTDISAIGHNEGQLEEALEGLSNDLGYERFAFFHAGNGDSFAVSNYAADYQSTYTTCNFKAIDPVLGRSKRLMKPFTWSFEQDRQSLSKRQIEMYGVAADFGIRSGVTLPVRTPYGTMSMLTLASDRTTVCTESESDALAAAAAVGQLHARIVFLRTRSTTRESGYFTPKEAKYLRWVEAGKTMEEIAEIEGVKYNTVRINLENAKKRFGVYNITQLTAIAIRRRLI